MKTFKEHLNESENDKLEDAVDTAIQNEWDTVSRASKYKKYSLEQKHGIVRVRVFARASYYADTFHVNEYSFKALIVKSNSTSDWRYWEREAKKKLYAD